MVKKEDRILNMTIEQQSEIARLRGFLSLTFGAIFDEHEKYHADRERGIPSDLRPLISAKRFDNTEKLFNINLLIGSISSDKDRKLIKAIDKL